MIRHFRTAVLLSVILGMHCVAANKLTLTDFNSQKVASYETQMWQAYYSRDFKRLFVNMVSLFSEQFHLSTIDAILAGGSAVQAARTFKKIPHRAPKAYYEKKVLPSLNYFYKTLHRNTHEDWDIEKLAKAELSWWVARRKAGENNFVNIGREITKVYALLYGTVNQCLIDAGLFRAQAADLRDRQHRAGQVNWQEVETLLQLSYKKLKRGVRGCTLE